MHKDAQVMPYKKYFTQVASVWLYYKLLVLFSHGLRSVMLAYIVLAHLLIPRSTHAMKTQWG